MAISKRKQKRSYTGMIGIVLVALLFISITYAYLQSHTDESTNTFTLGEGVKVNLVHDNGVHGDFTPGSEYDKPARVVIPDTAMHHEYIAVKVQFFAEIQGTDGNLTLQKIDNTNFLSSYAHLQSYNVTGSAIDVTGATKQAGVRKGWVTKDNKIFYYGTKVGEGNKESVQLTKVSSGSSVTVFDQIKVNDTYDHVYRVTDGVTAQEVDLQVDAKYKDIVSGVTKRTLKKGQLVTFHTVVSAYAVQGDVSSEQAMAEFDYLFQQDGTS